MRKGTLIYDYATDRYDIRFGLESYYGGLHCGECLEVNINGKWEQTRIEKGDDWYLVGVITDFIIGLEVRI